MHLCIYGYSPEGQSDDFDRYILGITEDGFYTLGSYASERVFHEIALDKNLIAAVNEKINVIGSKVSLNKKGIVFLDSKTSYNFGNSYYDEIMYSGRAVAKTEDNSANFFISLFYRDQEKKKMVMGIEYGFNAISVDGKEYPISFQIYLNKIQ